MTSGQPPKATGERTAAVLDEFCEAWFAGDRPDPDAFCRDHPDCGPELRQRIESFLDAALGCAHSAEEYDDLQGETLGDFRIIDEIGRGGMARVYEAEQISLKRRVALKVLSPHLSFSKQAVQKFRREAEAGSRQSHAGIVSVFAVGSIRGTHYIAQELVAGARTVADHLEELGREPVLPRGHFRQIAALIATVSAAVTHAHCAGVIHRDLKPSNILLTEEGAPKVTDFGLARVEGANALSQSGDFAGTPYYMSPEQARSSRSAIDRRTDIYSLGVTLYEALTLHRPFDGDTSHEVIKKILLIEPRDPRKVNARVPRDLAVICLKAMEKAPSKRYQSMEELTEDLERFLEGEPILARPSHWIGRPLKWVRRHKLLSVAAGTLLAALATVIVLLLVLALEQREARERALKRFEPVHEALVWSKIYSYRSAHTWCALAAPDEPEPDVMKGILDIALNNFDSAITALNRGLEKIETAEPTLLRAETRHLLAVAKLRQADAFHETSDKGQALIDAACALLPPGDDFDCTAPDALILRNWDDTGRDRDDLENLRRPIEVNTEHYMIPLYQGLLLFDRLYKSGESHEFEKAIGYFNDVLEKRPRNVAALSFKARIYYFLARFYDLMTLTEEALSLLEEAKTHSNDAPHHMIDTTIGQIHVLLGNNRQARHHFELAIDRAKGLEDTVQNHVHNSYRGLGKLLVRAGDFKPAWTKFAEALQRKEFDYHNNVAAAEYHFCRGDLDTALEYAEQATRHLVGGPTIESKAESGVAAAYLICARLHFARGEFEQISTYLDRVFNTPYISPRDLSLACFFIVGIIDEVSKDENKRRKMAILAFESAKRAIENAHFGDRSTPFGHLRSPMSLAAVGAAHYLKKEYPEAIESLKQALAERAEWPEEIKRYQWADDARDLYLLALVRSALAREKQVDSDTNEQKAQEYYRRAEALWASNELSYELADINKIIRQRARDAVGDR